jgi:hypothetical protein
MLGELVGETDTRYIYRRRHTSQTAFVDKRSPSIYIKPCEACPDYGERQPSTQPAPSSASLRRASVEGVATAMENESTGSAESLIRLSTAASLNRARR